MSEIKKVSLTQMVHVGLSSLFYCTIFSFLYSYLWRNLNNSCPVNWAATFNNRMITSYHIFKTNKPYDIFILFAAKEERYCQSSSFNDSHVHKWNATTDWLRPLWAKAVISGPTKFKVSKYIITKCLLNILNISI